MFNNGKAHYGAVRALMARPDGTILSVSSDLTARLWSADGSFIKRIPHSDIVRSILPLKDDHSVYAVFSGDRFTGLRQWHFDSVDHSVRISTVLHPYGDIAPPMHWLQYQRLVLRGSPNQLNEWDIENSPPTRVGSFVDPGFNDQIISVCSLESNNMMVAGCNTGIIKVWSLDTLLLLFHLNIDSPSTVAVLVQVGDATVASYQTNGCISIFDLTRIKCFNERRLRSWTHNEEENQYSNKFERPFCMVLLIGQRLCTSRSNTICIWDMRGCCHFSVAIPVSGMFCDVSCMVERSDRSIVIGDTSGRMTLFRPPTRFFVVQVVLYFRARDINSILIYSVSLVERCCFVLGKRNDLEGLSQVIPLELYQLCQEYSYTLYENIN